MRSTGIACAEPAGARPRIARSAPSGPHDVDVPWRSAPALRAVSASREPGSGTLDAIYGAALAPEHWPHVLAVLAAELGASAATLHAGTDRGPLGITAAFGISRAAVLDYGDRYGTRDPIAATAANGTAWPARITAREADDVGRGCSGFLAGWMRPNGFDDALCLGLLPPGGMHRAVLAVFRPLRARRFGSADASALARLAPHLRRAVELRRRLSAAEATQAVPLADALDRLAAGVALLDGRCRLAWANRPARRLLRDGDGLSLDRDGALRAATPATTATLRRLVAAAAAANVEGALPVPRPFGRTALALHVAPLPADAPERGTTSPAAGRPCALLLVSDPEGTVPDAALRRRLRAIWGLTAAEAVVAASAARGAGLPEVARSLNVAVATVRSHAQRVFDKAGVRGQAELARQVERLSLLRAAPDHAEP